MSNTNIENILKTAQLMADLAQNPEFFNAILDAYDKEDAVAFQSQLKNLGMLDYCEWICYWVCSKKCKALCDTLCPPLAAGTKPADIRVILQLCMEKRGGAKQKSLAIPFRSILDRKLQGDPFLHRVVPASQVVVDYCSVPDAQDHPVAAGIRLYGARQGMASLKPN